MIILENTDYFNRTELNFECSSQTRVKERQQHFTKSVSLTSHGFSADLSEIILVELLSNIHRLPIPITWRFHKYWRPLDETQYCHNSCRAIVLCDTTEAVCCLYAVRSMTERMFAWQKLAGYLLQTQGHYQCYFHLVHIKQTNIKIIYTAYILMYIYIPHFEIAKYAHDVSNTVEIKNNQQQNCYKHCHKITEIFRGYEMEK